MALSTEIDDLIPYHLLEGLRVFVIDHHTTQLHAIADMCFQSHYTVTTCTVASFALHLLTQTKPPCFDLILIDAQMPDMDSYEFLQRVTQEIKIPVIMMCGADDHTTSAAARMNAIQKGACDYWLKPLNVDQINNMWQHVATTQQHDDQIQRDLEVVKTEQKLKKRAEASETKETKKNRVSWRSSPKLEERFLRAVNQLGVDKATPKQITELMGVQGLKTEHVASHLQKFRLRLKSSSKKTKSKCGKENSKMDQYHVPNEVVESMPKQDKKCDNNFPLAQQQQPIPMAFDDFEVSNILTNKTNMMLDDSSSLYEQAWYPFQEFGTFGHYFD